MTRPSGGKGPLRGSSHALHRRRLLLACAGVAGLLALPACGGERRPNLLLVVVDTLRQDTLGCYGYADHPVSPEIDRLATASVRLTGLTGVSSWTQPSMATLFTGMPPAGHRVKHLFQPMRVPLTLARVLADAGYATGCVMSNFLLRAIHPQKGVGPTGYAEGYGFYDDQIALRPDPHSGSTASEVTDRALGWLREQPAGRPWFLTAHYFDPHVVYEAHPEYGFPDPGYSGWVRGGLSKSELRKHQAGATEADRRQLAAFYAGEVRAVDDAVGRLLAGLRARPDWADTVVVFTADHGEELAERGYIGHTVSLHFEQTDLPLLVRLPGGDLGGSEIRARRSQVDLFATILDCLGVAVPAGRGRSFAPLLRGEEEPGDLPCFSEVDFVPALSENKEKETRMRAVIAEGYKLVHDRDSGSWELYDLAADPGERRNLSGEPAHAARRQRLAALLRSHRWLP